MEDKLLEIINKTTPNWFSNKFFSVDDAYYVLSRLGYKNGGKPAAYRALNNLVKKGIIGKLDTYKRYFLYSKLTKELM